MNFDGLEHAYWTAQAERVERVRSKIAARAATPPGRVVPDDTDLTIGTGRRLNLTVMFIDISKFSQRSSVTGDEQEMLLRVLNLFFTEMIRIIEDYGGAVEKHTGDGLMAYFEDRAVGESDGNSAKRAVACALTMVAANEYLIAPILRASGVAPLQFRTAMDHGSVTIARLGAPQRFSANVAIGSAANFAAKMLAHVNPGDIALGASAKDRLPPTWQSAWTELSPINTGWVYSNTQQPYPLFLYKGRWSKLI